ncbi:MAG: hypothetical protein P4L33_10615 [Capsulimonadaceae bacterium]|nr:hypothetical protein [Capsulimonadaceae bacterium]
MNRLLLSTTAIVATFTILTAICGCGDQNGASHQASLLADDEWYRPNDGSILASFGGGKARAPLGMYCYFDLTASSGQGSLVNGAADDLICRIASFARFAPPHSRVEVYGTSNTPGQPVPLFEYEARFLQPIDRKAALRDLDSRLNTLKQRITMRYWLKWSPVLEDARFVADRAGESALRSHVYVYSDLEQFSPALTASRIFSPSASPGYLVGKALESMPRLPSPPEKIVAVRWPGVYGAVPLSSAPPGAECQESG